MERSGIRIGSTAFYLAKIEDFGQGIHFDRLEAFSTAGDFRPPYPFQWLATTKVRPGEDDPYEGIGGTPHEAIKNLYRQLERFDWDSIEEEA